MRNTFAPPDPNLCVIEPEGFPPFLAYGRADKGTGPLKIAVVS
jgi:hypothetical protein